MSTVLLFFVMDKSRLKEVGLSIFRYIVNIWFELLLELSKHQARYWLTNSIPNPIFSSSILKARKCSAYFPRILSTWWYPYNMSLNDMKYHEMK